MKLPFKVVSVVLILLGLALAGFVPVHAQAQSLPDKARAYLNFLPFALNQYSLNLSDSYTLPSAPSNPHVTSAVGYNLIHSSGMIRVVFVFRDGELNQVGLSGNPLYSRHFENLTDISRDILQRYQAVTGADSSDMLSTLNTLDQTNASAISSGNVQLTVYRMPIPQFGMTPSGEYHISATEGEGIVTYSWVFSYNGVPFNHFSISYQQGVLHSINDDRASSKIGSTEVKLTEQEAVDAAVQFLQNYSYVSGNQTVSGFILSNLPSDAWTLAMERNDSLLYPSWSVELYLNQTYPGDVKAFIVKLWADTGVVYECDEDTIGYHVPDTAESPAAVPESTMTEVSPEPSPVAASATLAESTLPDASPSPTGSSPAAVATPTDAVPSSAANNPISDETDSTLTYLCVAIAVIAVVAAVVLLWR